VAHTFTNLLFHVVFGTKQHVPSIDANLRAPLHARVKTIREEYLEFLHKHQIPYDPKYVFE
jgi:hypothetical protein